MIPNDLWYSPPLIINAVEDYFNGAYFDPCPVNHAYDGLNVSWSKQCFLNPPYSKELKRAFIRKAEQEFTPDSTYIWLVNYACSRDLLVLKSKASAVCLPNERIKFIPGDPSLGDGQSPRYDSIILMWGGDTNKFKECFGHIGSVYEAA